MSCGAAELWEASGLPEKRCAHPYCIPAPCACTSTVHQHFHACISERFSTARVHSYCIPALLARISIMFEHFGLVGVVRQFFRLIGVLWAGRAALMLLWRGPEKNISALLRALLLYSSTAWVLCYCVPATAFQHYFILRVFPLRVLILFLATSIFSMRISIVLQHFFVRAFLLCSTFLLYSKNPRQKCGQEGPLNHLFLLCGGMFGLSRGLRHPQNRDPKNDFVLEGSKAQRGRLDGETPPLFCKVRKGSSPCHLLRKNQAKYGD